MNQKFLHKVFIWGFLFLYFLVALISFCHAMEFFGIGNVKWMSISLAFAFELGLALSLASILLSDENKKQTLPWILMSTLTAVQVIGNVYSVFRYISLSEGDYYQYLAKPLLFFIEEVDENTIQVIISWIMGAILPIVALMMTDMVANNIKNMSSKDNSTENEEEIETSEFEEGNIPVFKTVEKKEEAKPEVKQKEEVYEAPAPIVQAPVSVDLEKIKEEVKPSVKEDEDNIANYVDVLTPSDNKKVERPDDSKKASFLNFIPTNLFKKRKPTEPYFKDPIVNHNKE